MSISSETRHSWDTFREKLHQAPQKELAAAGLAHNRDITQLPSIKGSVTQPVSERVLLA